MLRKRLAVGLDLGQYSLKCAVVDGDSGRVNDVWEREIFPERESLSQRIVGKLLEERLASLLAACRKDCLGFNNRAVTAIQGEPTFCRYVELPLLSGKQLDVAVVCEGLKYVPFPIPELSLSHTMVPPVNGGEKKSGVFLVAARKRSVGLIKQLFEISGISIERIEVPALALTREFSRSHRTTQGEFVLLVHIGYRLTHVVVVRDGYPYFATDIPWAGRDLIHIVQGAKQVTWEEARQLVVDSEAREEAGVKIYLQRLVRELRRSMSFFRQQLPEDPPVLARVVLSGGAASMRGLARYLSEALQMKVESNSWGGLKLRSKRMQEQNAMAYKVAVGLALGN